MKAVKTKVRKYYKSITVLPVLSSDSSEYGMASITDTYRYGTYPAYSFTYNYTIGENQPVNSSNLYTGPKFTFDFASDYYIPANCLCIFNYGCGNGNDTAAAYGGDTLKITVTYTDNSTEVVFYKKVANPDYTNNPDPIMITNRFVTGNKITKSIYVEVFQTSTGNLSIAQPTGGYFTINGGIESTSSDYDFYEDEEGYKVVKEGNNYYAINQ